MRMGKRIRILASLLALLPLCAAGADPTPLETRPWRIEGFIGANGAVRFDLETSVLPFDVEDVQVRRNTDPATVRGLRVGMYNVLCNTAFSLTISHDKLTHATQGGAQVDYRLDVFFASAGGSLFKTVYDGQPATITQEDLGQPEPPYSIIDKAFYVSMNATDEEIEALPAGRYSSTITFEFVVGD